MRKAAVLGMAMLGSTIAVAQLPADQRERNELQSAIQLQSTIRATVFRDLVDRDSDGMRGQWHALVGREDISPHTKRDRPRCDALAADPLVLIAEEARKTNIVIINESHSSPRERHFVSQVLDALRQEGFDTYAAEALSHSDLKPGRVLGGDGFYSNEPIFARTLLHAMALGYRLVAYEASQRGNEVDAASSLKRRELREQGQADNLMAAIFSKQPDAKVVIHVGGGHGNERRDVTRADGIALMGERLKAATGRDPLTINQIECESGGTSTVIGRGFSSGEDVLVREFPMDLYVGHPRLTFLSGRPAWRREIDDKPVPVPFAFLSSDERVIVEARPVGASLSEVPTDRLILFPGERLPMLLPPGRYRIDGFTPAGRIAGDSVQVEVK